MNLKFREIIEKKSFFLLYRLPIDVKTVFRLFETVRDMQVVIPAYSLYQRQPQSGRALLFTPLIESFEDVFGVEWRFSVVGNSEGTPRERYFYTRVGRRVYIGIFK